jgi:NADH-quinone oxidoreductase subunit H
LAAHSLRVGGVVAGQGGLWYVVWMPVAFAIFLICALAASFYGPFATPTAADLGGGVLAELAGVDRLLPLVGRYMVLVSASGLAVAMVLGGGAGPVLPSAAWSLLKTFAVLGVLVAARWRWPLVRMERFEEFAWVVLLPASVLQALIVSLVVL